MTDVFGTITSIIDLIDRAKDLYQKLKDVKDLPEAFETITAQIDLAKSIFEKVKTNTSLVSRYPELQAAIKSCGADAKALNAIYELVSETKGRHGSNGTGTMCEA
jgi:phosphoenolpyruvate carboxylase